MTQIVSSIGVGRLRLLLGGALVLAGLLLPQIVAGQGCSLPQGTPIPDNPANTCPAPAMPGCPNGMICQTNGGCNGVCQPNAGNGGGPGGPGGGEFDCTGEQCNGNSGPCCFNYICDEPVDLGNCIRDPNAPPPNNGQPPDQTNGEITLIEPLGPNNKVPITSGFGTFIFYFNDSFAWILEVAVGFVVVWVLISGFLYMTSGNNQTQRADAVQRMTWAITGLLLLLFAGIVLRTLNSLFYT